MLWTWCKSTWCILVSILQKCNIPNILCALRPTLNETRQRIQRATSCACRVSNPLTLPAWNFCNFCVSHVLVLRAKGAERRWKMQREGAWSLEVSKSLSPVFHYYAVNRSGHQKSDMRYHLAHLCDYLQTCQGPCDCKPLNHELRMCANIVHVFACRSRELLHSKLPSSHNQPSSTPKSFWGKRHGAHFAAQSGVYCPQQPVLTHLSRLVSACRSNTLGWAPSFRLTVCISLMRTYVPLSKHGIWGVIHPIMGIYGNPFSVGKYKSL